jgi:cytochrome c2
MDAQAQPMNRLYPLAFALLVLSAHAASPKLGRGEAQYRAYCIGCHSFGCNRGGPKLADIFNRKAAAVPDFKFYSEGLKSSGIVWSDETLDAFLRDPAKLVPGTGMAAIGRVERAEDRKEILAFLRRQDRSIDLCF